VDGLNLLVAQRRRGKGKPGKRSDRADPSGARIPQ